MSCERRLSVLSASSLVAEDGCGREAEEYRVGRRPLCGMLRTALSVAKESVDDLPSKSSMPVDWRKGDLAPGGRETGRGDLDRCRG